MFAHFLSLIYRGLNILNVSPAIYKLNDFKDREFEFYSVLFAKTLPLLPIFEPLPKQFNLVDISIPLIRRQ